MLYEVITLPRRIGIVGTGRRGRQPGQVEVVLDGEGNAVEGVAVKCGPLQGNATMIGSSADAQQTIAGNPYNFV